MKRILTRIKQQEEKKQLHALRQAEKKSSHAERKRKEAEYFKRREWLLNLLEKTPEFVQLHPGIQPSRDPRFQHQILDGLENASNSELADVLIVRLVNLNRHLNNNRWNKKGETND